MAKSQFCALCNEPIERRPSNPDDRLGVDHVPPKLFFPKSARSGLNLWTVTTHQRCNVAYKLDEEYFCVQLYPLVANANSETAPSVFADLRRRARQPQTPVLIRDLLRTQQTVTPGGILLPEGSVRLTVNLGRIQRVAVKIARELFFHRYQRFMPERNCRRIHLCESPEDAPEHFRMSWQFGEEIAVCPNIFLYRIVSVENAHLMSLLFWQGFMFCLEFVDPATESLTTTDAGI